MNIRRLYSKQVLLSRFVSLLLTMLVATGISPQNAKSQTPISSQLEFFLYPPNWNYPYEEIVGESWLANSTKRAITVAMAAPLTPRAGIPKTPKINM